MPPEPRRLRLSSEFRWLREPGALVSVIILMAMQAGFAILMLVLTGKL